MQIPRDARVPFTKRGFALIIVLSVMFLLTIIALGILSLSSVTLRSSSRGEAHAMARANARLSLMMAIGELQKEMGPDTRISSPHDVGSSANGGQPHWTAVYDAWKRPVDPATAESPTTRTPTFRRWLLSGANQATGGPAGSGDIVKLVGQNSLGSTAVPEDHVSAPTHRLTVGKNQGQFAWWVADESTKAKINAGPDTALASNPLFDSQSPPHINHQSIAELDEFKWKTGQRSMAITNGVVNLAAAIGPRGIGNINHDITVHSAGVLADVRAGHLKRDLTNLLSRPVAELENKPLYLADGRMNRFEITDAGAISSTPGLPANAAGADRWGINLEELHLFHQLHREVDWSTGKPQLVNKNSREAMIQDRFFLYRKPKMEAQSVMLSFIAEPDAAQGAAPGTYSIAAMIDAMVVNSNPNDIPIVWPASVLLRMEMEGFPYRPRWNIRRANGTVRHSHTAQAINYPYFRSSISGGFTLEPGEAGVFGASTTDTSSESVNLTRGYVPRGGLRIADKRWDSDNNFNPATDGLRATGLLPGDTMDFTMIPAPTNVGSTPSGWISCYAKIRNASGGSDTGISTHRLAGGGGSVLTSAPISTYMPSSIRPPQNLMISEFIGTPLPVLMATTMPNVEKSRVGLLPPNAFASRAYYLHEPAINTMVVSTTSAQNTNLTMQNSQLVVIAEPMDYEFGSDRTMAAGVGGRNLYHGGARELGLGGSINVIKRRIPLAAPLSLGAFEHAIASGLVQRFAAPGNAFTGNANSLPAMAKTIGNSWSSPFINSNTVFNGTDTDPSWMVNTALWDSWFLSGIVDARSLPSGSWATDNRSPREQFREFALSKAKLKNQRFLYHQTKSLEATLDELFDSDLLKPSAIKKLPAHLLVDGAFNVNSTSLDAWKALLSSVREQQLFVNGGAKQQFGNPLGTLGYAYNNSPTNDWAGLRDLTDTEIDTLAKAIVVEVKSRGPFLSMTDFVNRRPNSSDATHQALGALQSAIDKSGLNNRYKGPGRDLAPANIAVLAGKDTLTNEPAPARAIGSAGFLSQAAILNALGPQITVRGDTFCIRAYGDHRDASGTILAKSWCEAVVQRVPEYVNSTDAPEASENLTLANSTFGRKFTIISFRWLNSEEI